MWNSWRSRGGASRRSSAMRRRCASGPPASSAALTPTTNSAPSGSRSTGLARPTQRFWKPRWPRNSPPSRRPRRSSSPSRPRGSPKPRPRGIGGGGAQRGSRAHGCQRRCRRCGPVCPRLCRARTSLAVACVPSGPGPRRPAAHAHELVCVMLVRESQMSRAAKPAPRITPPVAGFHDDSSRGVGRGHGPGAGRWRRLRHLFDADCGREFSENLHAFL
mmetsp:Transcript_1474/g.4280  ORF Transcript_1474/g.4280 Transcript_1474/m.4280 type:complete len:218 (-) Transcript_1474:101-754(-)